MVLRRRSHFRVAVMVIVCLLFQQAAMAAYACTMSRMPGDQVAMPEGCVDMPMDVAPESLALCAKHCAPDRSTAADHAALSVPMLALSPAFELVLFEPRSPVAIDADVAIDRSDPPPRLRYCSLLI